MRVSLLPKTVEKAQGNQKGALGAPRWEGRATRAPGTTVLHARLAVRGATELAPWDPKDGELCLSRVKPGETLVEARSDADVQIAHLTWV